MQALEERSYDLVLALPNLGSMDCRGFGGRVKEKFPHMPVILLAHGLQDLQDSDPSCQAIDETFVWHCDTDLLPCSVKSVEDARNVNADIATAGVRVILLVEDSPSTK